MPLRDTFTLWHPLQPQIVSPSRTHLYSLSHDHGSGKLSEFKGNYYWRDPFSTSMIMGGRGMVVFSPRKFPHVSTAS